MNQQESTNLDPRILGQLLLMQSILPTLPDETSIFRFVCRGLSQIPGVETVNHSEIIQENIDPSIARFPLTVSSSEYGEFLFRVSNPVAFALYSDYIKNFSFMVAVILEERNQRRLNELHKVELEQRIQERTLQLREEIAERQRIEDALRESERKFRETVVNLDEGFYSATIDGVLLEHNQAFNRILGFDEMVDLKGTNVPDFWQNPDDRQVYLNAFAATGSISNYQINAKTQKGGKVTLLVSAHMVKDENNRPVRIEGIFLDVTERKRSEEALHQSEEEYRQLFQSNPNPMWAYDPETLAFLEVNDAAVSHYGYSRDEFLAMTIKDIRPPEDIAALIDETAHLPAGLNKPKIWRHIKKDGTIIYVEIRTHWSAFAGRRARIVLANDVTERKRAEDANQSYIHFLESLELIDKAIRQETDIEKMLKDVMEKVFTIFNCDRTWLFYPCDPDAPTFRVPIEINKPEYPGANTLGHEVPMHPSIAKDLREALASEGPLTYTLGTAKTVNTLSAQQFAVKAQMLMAVYPKIGKPWVFGMHQCSHARIWTNEEKTLFNEIGHRVADGLSNTLFFRDLKESEERFRTLVNQAADAIFLHDMEGRLLDVNQRACISLGYSRNELLGMNVADLDVGFVSQNDVRAFWSQLKADRPVTLESMHKRKDGTTFPVEIRLGLLQIGGKQSILALVRDITARKQAEEKIQEQFEHLAALGAIDQVIVSNFDLKLGLAKILTHVTTELGIDAANILIFNSDLQMLEYSAGYGFRTKAIESTRLLLGQSYAGQAALERHLIHVNNLKDAPGLMVTKNLLEEGFVSYYAVPLIAKGQVKGVLEVFHRTPLEPNAEWLDFLNTLAGQVAIAIENATLFESLQRSNLELTLAYDATIEGWSRALDLRDKETEGHTRRVTEMALKLARAFGLSEDELVQVRWGALLHDIGKMGVPDEILHKPGPLTDEEWMLMKKHPTYAQEMLAPIHYLRQALDIPYCHHEKWDGSGYPQGLIGDQIPLSARIFAVVDVWDALRSDRPYRAAWPEEKVRDYIQSSSGTHFDPQVVDVFLRVSN